LHDAYAHARKLIDKILFRVGHDDAEGWKVVILNNEHDAQMIIPFSVSHTFRAQRRATVRESCKNVMLYLGHPEGLHGIKVTFSRFEANIF
jgi:hypothetical protein